MVYLTPKTTRGQQYWYLVKSFKFNGRVEKVQHYLGSEEPSERELEQLKAIHGPELELAAVERMAKASAEMFRTPYLDTKALKGLERLKFLRRALNRLQQDRKAREREAEQSELEAVYGNLILTSEPLAREQTEAILLHDRAPAGIPLSRVLEVLALRRLHREVSERVARLDRRAILKLHLEVREGQGDGGHLRQDSASLPGSAFVPPPPVLIEDELDALLEWWHDPSPLHSFERATLFHHRFLQLRPFEAGNGLVARLLLEGMLVRAGLPAPMWQREDRSRYLSALVAGDRGDRGRLISGFWKAYRQHHRSGVRGELAALKTEPRQAHLEAF